MERDPTLNRESRMVKKCSQLIKNNRVGVAVQHLESFTKEEVQVLLSDPEVRTELKRLHPRHTDSDNIPVPRDIHTPLSFSREVLSELVMDLPKLSGCGLYPWSNELIWLCWRHSDQLKEAIEFFISQMINGRFAEKSIWLVCRLLALQIPDGKLRPIAVADPWIRLASRLAVRLILPRTTDYLGEYQMGIGKSGGAEISVHAVSMVADAIVKREADLAVLS